MKLNERLLPPHLFFERGEKKKTISRLDLSLNLTRLSNTAAFTHRQSGPLTFRDADLRLNWALGVNRMVVTVATFKWVFYSVIKCHREVKNTASPFQLSLNAA